MEDPTNTILYPSVLSTVFTAMYIFSFIILASYLTIRMKLKGIKWRSPVHDNGQIVYIWTK